MAAIDAHIATSCQDKCCDHRDLPAGARFATPRGMDVIDRDWLQARMRGQRGMQARLARALGITRDQMSKVMTGVRRVQPEEIPTVLAFFADIEGRQPQPFIAQPGLSEPAVAPFRVPANHTLHDLVRLVAPAAKGATFYRIRAPQPAFALNRGDILIVDLGAQPRPNDLAVITRTDPDTGAAATDMARWLPPWLIPGDTAHQPEQIDPASQRTAILGTVRAMMRAPALG